MVFEYLYNIPWKVYEKIDGFNCQVYWNGEDIQFSGKSDNTFFTDEQLVYLKETFTTEIFNRLGLESCYLFGELVGPRCNGNPYNLSQTQFVLFDSYRQFTQCWQDDPFLEIVAEGFGIWVAPLLFTDTLKAMTHEIQNQLPGYESTLFPGRKTEGFILRPFCELSTTPHGRVITKLKHRDRFIEGFNL